jgi:hypothetical protein
MHVMELDQPDAPGGALFEWNVVDGGFERRFNGLETWLAYTTKLLNTDRYEDHTWGDRRRVFVPGPEAWEEEPSWRPALPEHELYGDVRLIERNMPSWPERWQRLAAHTPETSKLKGRTHTIAEILATGSDRPDPATVVARVAFLLGSPVRTSTVQVSDGTGVLAVRCPTEKGARPRVESWFEFDVTLPPDRSVDPPAVVATAVRRAAQPD